MNQQLKTVLLTVLTLSFFVIALVELSGVSKTAIFNKFHPQAEILKMRAEVPREQQIGQMPKTIIYFYDKEHQFGTINEGDVVKYAYRFKNTGTNPLMIARADASCGCTIPSFSKEPIQPGGEGEIVVQFNSHGHPGAQIKNILVHSNAQEEAISLSFSVDVTKK